MPAAEAPKSYLTLGWKVDGGKDAPKFWVKDVKPGNQTDEHLVKIPANSMGCHTAIIAQSGSGKSFFLGRLIEELMLETQCRCVILDPNADFRRIGDIVDKSRWENAGYDFESDRGFLPHESSKDIFAQRWKLIPKRIEGGPGFSSGLLNLHWPSLSFEFLADEVEGMQRSDLYHCHEFVRAIAYLLELKHLPVLAVRSSPPTVPEPDQNKPVPKPIAFDFIDEANKLLKRAKRSDPQDLRDLFEREFNADQLSEKAGSESKASAALAKPDADAESESKQATPKATFETIGFWYTTRRKIGREDIKQVIERAIAAVEYISDDVQRYYFGKAKEYASQRIVRTKVGRQRKAEYRLKVIDLPSFPDQKTRFLALNSVLSTIWEQARSEWAKAVEDLKKQDTRVPTFIVVDEAHNLLPKQPDKLAAKALLEQFRSIAAEGRKYGLFLILCTQRPDKIDELVLSECENQAIMRLGSQSVLDLTTKLLGLEEVQDRKKCLEFETGRALLIGRWAKPSPKLLYTAMRRTEEGGKNLRDAHWATPQESAAKPDKIGKLSPASPETAAIGANDGQSSQSKHTIP
jgi:hypothetical protein